MKFSILISSFNKGKYLKKCIISCLNQKDKDCEIIEVVFDNPEFSSELTTMALTGLPLLPMTETVTDDSQHQTDDDALASDDGAGGLAGILLMLPMLFLF